MLKQLKVRNFRLLHDITLDFEQGVPVVAIGPNSSGKSTLIEVLDFLATAVSEGLEKAAYRDRQGPSDFLTAGRGEPLVIEVLLSVPSGGSDDQGEETVSYSCAITPIGGYLRVDEEEIEIIEDCSKGEEYLVLERIGPNCRVFDVFSKAWYPSPVKTDELALAKVELEGRLPTLSNVRRALGTLGIFAGFSTLPSWARDPREGTLGPRESAQLMPVERLDRRGLDLINALYSLQNLQPERWQALVHHLQQEFPFVERLTFPPDPGGARLALGWNDKRYPGVLLRAQHMSSGMIHFLSLLAAALPAEAPILLAFDEPEAHLHPSAVRRMVHLLETLSEQTSVLVATHSSQFLEFLDDPARSVVTCSAEEKGVELQRLDPEALKVWLEDYSMTELRRRGLLDASNEFVPELV